MAPLGNTIALALVALVKAWLSTLPPDQEAQIGNQLGLD